MPTASCAPAALGVIGRAWASATAQTGFGDAAVGDAPAAEWLSAGLRSVLAISLVSEVLALHF